MYTYIVLFCIFQIINGLSPQKLVLNNYNLVHHLINKKFYYLPSDIKDEVKQQSFIGLIKASERFDPEKNIKFSTYASYYIKGYEINFLKKLTLYQKTYFNYDFHTKPILKVDLPKRDHYDLLDHKYLVDKFYATCEEKEIVYDYFHNKLSKYEIAKKTNLTSKTISYKINRSLYLFKINNNIESYR